MKYIASLAEGKITKFIFIIKSIHISLTIINEMIIEYNEYQLYLL